MTGAKQYTPFFKGGGGYKKKGNYRKQSLFFLLIFIFSNQKGLQNFEM